MQAMDISEVSSLRSMRTLLLGGAGAWAAACFVALAVTGAARMDAPQGAFDTASALALAAAVVVWIPLLAGRFCLGRAWSGGVCLFLSALMAFICLGMSINVQGWCAGGDLWHPVLGFSDAGRAWDGAGYLMAGDPMTIAQVGGYSWLLSRVLPLIGGGVVAAVAMSALAAGVAAVVIIAIGVTLFPGLAPRRVAIWSLTIYACVPSVEWFASMPLKETLLILGMSLCVLTVARAVGGIFGWCEVLSCLCGCAILFLLRSPLGWWVVVAGLSLALYGLWRGRKGRLLRRKMLIASLLLVAAGATTSVGGGGLRHHDDSQYMAGENASLEHGFMQVNKGAESYFTPMSGYFMRPVWQRLALLPVTAASMYFAPLPYHFTRDLWTGRFVPWAHVPLWYVVGFFVIAYFLFCLPRGGRRGDVWPLSIIVILGWLSAAYGTGGGMARYTLPLLPAMVPLALQSGRLIFTGVIPRRKSLVVAAVYVILLGGALIAYYLLS